MEYEVVIGLEIHSQLQTQSKIFSHSSAAFGGEPNTKVDPVCLGLPGVLPVLNKQVVNYAMRMGLATNCRIAPLSIFARKNYFYPDSPKGYQISQFEEPICEHGYLDIETENGKKRIGITRIHLEEDAGKSVHSESFVASNETLIDVNRCGTPLIEIVSEPDMRSPQEAYAFLTQIRQIVQYLEICDGNMEEGSLRCDANISIRPKGQKELGVKTELKNMNSFRGVEKALEYEISRQIACAKSGDEIHQQTLLWDADKNIAIPMRSKEYSHDYRYFPEPDLTPVIINDDWIEEIKTSLPELPKARQNRFVDSYKLPQYDAEVLTDQKPLADYFEKVAETAGDAKQASNWVMGEVLRYLKEGDSDINNFRVSPEDLGTLLKSVSDGAINAKTAKSVLSEAVTTGKKPEAIIKEKNLVQISDTSELSEQVKKVLADNPNEVEKFLGGKEQVIGFLMGQVMRATRGQANPKVVNDILREQLVKLK